MINNSLKKKWAHLHNHCFDVASKMKLCPPKSATGQKEQNKRELFNPLAVCGAACRERVFSLSLSFNDPLLMIKLQECQKEG